MCRFVAYLGEPIYLDTVVCTPRHSLVRQALKAEEAHTVTNGDGFGVGWYGDRTEPGVYREVMPAWSDENLLALCATVRSGLFFAHVRAATGGGIARTNCHPFRHGKWLFMHNGQIGGYAGVRRALEAQLPERLYAARRGATDSELLFLLALARIETGVPPADAMQGVLQDTQALMTGLGIAEPLRFAAALSDGRQLLAFRFASDDRPPSLYVGRRADGHIVASEPLDGSPDAWQGLPASSWVRVDEDGVTLHS
ncbi:class II glutamine amidotransferase [Pseudaquabacterium pictum]|uniref:Class II glutamine amidotransferase n=1 Tax=Pseudaquabacterium pictum TaxID=2315236 RepID=A0A480AV08_9BURK|nr:class II glutamine amidotransferase [Rubrivivax pictus]GCL65251.1 class II glutamine amidotransferase [Rubrivivax pictus]